MKKSLKTLNYAGGMLMAAALLFSCNKEESTPIVEQETFEVAELKASDESELISEEILNIAEDVYTSDEVLSTSRFS